MKLRWQVNPNGLELSDLNSVDEGCKNLILSVLREEQSDEELIANRQFQVEDEDGRTVLMIPFRLALSAIRVGRC